MAKKTKKSKVVNPQQTPSRPVDSQPSGSDSETPPKASPSLPTPDRIEKVLR